MVTGSRAFWGRRTARSFLEGERLRVGVGEWLRVGVGERLRVGWENGYVLGWENGYVLGWEIVVSEWEQSCCLYLQRNGWYINSRL